VLLLCREVRRGAEYVTPAGPQPLTEGERDAIAGSPMHPLQLVDGQLVPLGTPGLAPTQMGLLSGFGVFSTLRVASSVLFEWDRHWARMSHDAEAIGLPMPSGEAVRADLARLVAANDAVDATLRVIVVRNSGGMWGAPAERPATVVGFTRPLTAWGSSARLVVVPHGRHAANRFSTLKVLSWVHNLATYDEVHARGFDEALLLNERGEIAECTSANVFFVFGDEVWTPPCSSGCLPGVTRALLVEGLGVEGVRVVERAIDPATAAGADEVFITSSTRDLLPVGSIAGVALRQDRASTVRARLAEAFARHRDDYVRRALGAVGHVAATQR